MTKLTIEEIATQIPDMEKAAAVKKLQEYTRAEIQEVAHALKLTISKSTPKGRAIDQIVGHFAYLRVHNQMQNRRNRNDS